MTTLELSPIEKIMVEELERHRINKIADIHPQYEIGPYRVDFLLIPKHGQKKGIIIECDGKYHDEPEVIIYDDKRQKFLEDQGYTVLRFKGADINYHYTFDDGFMTSQIKKEIMRGVKPYATGLKFIEIVDSDGNVFLVPF